MVGLVGNDGENVAQCELAPSEARCILIEQGGGGGGRQRKIMFSFVVAHLH